MQPNSNAPGGSHGNEPAPNAPKVDSPLSRTEPTSGPEGSSYKSYDPGKQSQSASRPGDDKIDSIVNSGKKAAAEANKWLDAHDVADTAKDLGSKALHGIKTMSTSQIAIGVGVLAAGIAFFITKGKSKYPKVRDQRGGRHKDKGHPTGHQPHTPRGNDMSHRGQRPFSTSRYGAPDGGAGSHGRVQAGSGRNARRDQGPNGQRYNPSAGGRQNPNNVDQRNSAY